MKPTVSIPTIPTEVECGRRKTHGVRTSWWTCAHCASFERPCSGHDQGYVPTDCVTLCGYLTHDAVLRQFKRMNLVTAFRRISCQNCRRVMLSDAHERVRSLRAMRKSA